MKKYNLLFLLLLSVSIMGTYAAENKNSKTKTQTTTAKEPATNPKVIKWLTWDEMVKLNEKTPKKIFVDFYTDWCGWCKVMDRNTFEDTIVAELMNKDFYCVKFNAERRDTITFLNKQWKHVPGGRNGYHELAAYFMQNQLSYPTFTVLTHDYKLITPLKGYIAPPQFEPIISFLGKDYWKPEAGKNLDLYKQEYVSPRTTPWVQPQ